MTNANNLTKAIITYIRARGGHANRINNIARQVEGRFVKSTTEKGIPDIIACIRGAYVGIEVKIGKDRQSPEQREQEDRIGNAGGHYHIARTFDQIQPLIDRLFDPRIIAALIIAFTMTGCATAYCNCSNPKPRTSSVKKHKSPKVKPGELQLAEPKLKNQ